MENLPVVPLVRVISYLSYEDILSLWSTCSKLAATLGKNGDAVWRAVVEHAMHNSMLLQARERCLKWEVAAYLVRKMEGNEEEETSPFYFHGVEIEPFKLLVTSPSDAWLGPVENLMAGSDLAGVLSLASCSALSLRQQAMLFSLAERQFRVGCGSCRAHIVTMSLDITSSAVHSDDVVLKKIRSEDAEVERPVLYDLPLFRVAVGKYQVGPNCTSPTFRLSPMVWQCNMELCRNIRSKHNGTGCCGESCSSVECSSCGHEVGLYSNDCCGGVEVGLGMTQCVLLDLDENDEATWKTRIEKLASNRVINL